MPDESSQKLTSDEAARLILTAVWPNLTEEEKRRLEEELRRNFLAQRYQSARKGVEVRANERLLANLDSVKQEIEQLRQEQAGIPTAVTQKLEEIENRLTAAKEESTALTAPVTLPSDMSVQLVPSHSLDHLDEVRSDESKAYLLIGTFTGAEVGIVVNWATDEEFTITRPSVVLIVLFGLLLCLSGLWAWQLQKRGQKLKNRMFNNSRITVKEEVKHPDVQTLKHLDV